MTNFEIAVELADIALIVDENKGDVPNGYHWRDVLYQASKDIAGERAIELYPEYD